MKKGQLIIISGPSGVGKGTIRERLFEEDQERLHLFFSISMTTREPRPGEQEGTHYYFVSDEVFDQRIEEGKFLEHASFSGHKYGTPADKVEEKRNEGYNVLLEIEAQGALQVMEKAPDCLSIFLAPPSMEELEKRLRGRETEEEAQIQKRLKQAEWEMTTRNHYKYIVVNYTIDQAKADIVKIIEEAC